jgi:chromosome segregation ATPase
MSDTEALEKKEEQVHRTQRSLARAKSELIQLAVAPHLEGRKDYQNWEKERAVAKRALHTTRIALARKQFSINHRQRQIEVMKTEVERLTAKEKELEQTIEEREDKINNLRTQIWKKKVAS